MFLLNVMLFLKVLRVIEFLSILLVASIIPSGDTNNSIDGVVDILEFEEKLIIWDILSGVVLPTNC